MKTALLVLSAVAALASVVHGFPGGAPNDACPQVSPTAGGHLVGPQNTPSPYNITGLPSEYTPGETYTLTFLGISGTLFRGMLVVSWDDAGARVGAFISGIGTRRTCDDSRGITHVDRNDKSSLSFMWTAPSAGTGRVTFRYAAVQVRRTYWGNQEAGVVQERVLLTPAVTPTPSPTFIPSTSTTFSPSPIPTPAFNCTGVYCNKYQWLNPYTCSCECHNQCNGYLYPDPETCECRCPYVQTETAWFAEAQYCAQYGAQFNPVTCGCSCVQAYSCGYNQYYNDVSCSCECSNYYSCSDGMYFNSDSCRCECSKSYCPPGFYQNPKSCECECSTYCGYDEVLDYYTCQCRKKSQYPDVQCSSLQYLYTCLNSESLYGISCQWQNGECVTECCSPKPSRSPHIGYKVCPHLDYYRCDKSEYCNWRCGGSKV